MTGEIKNATTVATPTVTTQSSKRPYLSPKLQVYGSVQLVTQGTGSVAGDSGPQSMPKSDIGVKENLVRIGTHPLGFGLYLFDYKPAFAGHYGRGRQFGVVAQEVERVRPQAVEVDVDGYKMVNYATLGICRVLH